MLEEFKRNGMVELFTNTSIYGDLTTEFINKMKHHPDTSLLVKSVDSLEQLSKWPNPFANGFGVNDKDKESFRKFFENFHRFYGFGPGSNFRSFYVEKDGEVVATASSSFGNSNIGAIYNVAVPEKFRGNNYGKIALAAALEDLMGNNIFKVGQFASPEGKALYKKLGAQIGNEYKAYTLKY